MITEVKKNIFIDNYQRDFEEQVKADLQKIEKNPIGKRLIEKIAAGAHSVFILYVNKGSKCIPCNITSARDPKKGSASDILYEPTQRREVLTYHLQPLEAPNFITLVHELIHAHHNSRGKNAQTKICDKRVWTSDEEYNTIMGFPSKKSYLQPPKITENAFRIAQGLPRRYGHLGFAVLQRDPDLAAHIKLEQAKPFAKRVVENKIRHDSVFPPIRKLATEDLTPVDKRIAACSNTIFKNMFYTS